MIIQDGGLRLKIKLSGFSGLISAVYASGDQMINGFSTTFGPGCMKIKNKYGKQRFILMATPYEIRNSMSIENYRTPLHYKKANKVVSGNDTARSYEEYVIVDGNEAVVSALKEFRRADRTFAPCETITNYDTFDILVAVKLTQNISRGLPDLRGGTKYVYKILTPGSSTTLPKESPTITLAEYTAPYTLSWEGFVSDGGHYEISESAAPTMVEDTFGVFS